jgi:hypothetical protein
MNPYDTGDDPIWVNTGADDTIWINSTAATTGTLNFTLTTNGAYLPNYTRYRIIPDKNWMPYRHFEYDPLWHKKFASIKYQMKKMWD